jgi:hypothetical protein
LNGFFRNRYGFDKLNIVLALFSLLFIFTRLWIIGVLLLGFDAFRALSRDFPRRRRELMSFERGLARISNFTDRLFRPLVNWIERSKARRRDKKFYKYIKCRYCKKKLRIPKGKGKIKVTCPECKNQFITKT